MKNNENLSTGPAVQRDGFRSVLGAFTATLGSAVGLGNIWKFPYLTGVNGGAAFVFAYLICVAVVGLPLLVAEHVIGRRMRLNAVHAYENVVPNERAWSLIGFAGVLAAVLIMAFYTDIAGWVFAYVAKSVAAFATGSGPLTKESFASLAGGSLEPLAWQAGVIALVTVVIAAGVSRGIEKVTKFLMPVLLGLLILCDIRALSLPGAFKGVSFLFAPDFSKITGGVILAALGLSFFKLSLGMGTMTTYGSYLPDGTRIVPNATRVALADTVVSLLAGLAVFPAVFAFGFEPSAGPSLLFISVPMIFSKMPLGGLFTSLFFILAAIAAVGAMISLIEVPTAWMSEKGRIKRPVAAVISGAVMLLLGVLATLSQGPILSNVKIFGKNFFDVFDFASSNVLLPIGGVAIAIVAGWRLARKEFIAELDKGYGKTPWYSKTIYAFIKFVAPVLIVVILLNSLGLLKL
jgi:neurotransmitter:Na+ symporter, NSS family